MLNDFLIIPVNERERIYYFPNGDKIRCLNTTEVKVCRHTNCHFITAENGRFIIKDKWLGIQIDADCWIYPAEEQKLKTIDPSDAPSDEKTQAPCD